MTSLTTEVPTTARSFDTSDAASLRNVFRGQFVLPSDAGYAEARRAWNGMVDKRPGAIAYCNGPDDVAALVTFAQSRTLPVSVRAGGHNVAGCCICQDGLVIDVSRMKHVSIDPLRRTARVQAGLTLGEFDAATQRFGLATTMGVNSDTGIAGLILGGGFGKLGRKHGLTCDNLLSADIVIADGRMLRASQQENPELFWGIRGGGGNFGIATAFEYRLHPVGPSIIKASLAYDFMHARDALRAYYAFSSAASDEISADAALARSPAGEPLFVFSICYLGSVDDGERAVTRALKELKSKVPPLDESVASVPYLEVQSAADRLFTRGRRYYWKAQFLREITDDAIDALLQGYAKAPSPASLVVLQQVGGAIARVPIADSAYAQRDASYDCFPISIWDDPSDDEANIGWARDLWAAIRPFSTGGVYVNNLGDEGHDRVRAAYGENFGRLVALKRKYDPTNFFRLNQNIDPDAETG
jgi:FAD/FMN-containing dehydrogenase